MTVGCQKKHRRAGDSVTFGSGLEPGECMFRSIGTQVEPSTPWEVIAVAEWIDAAMQPGHFLLAPDLQLEWVAAKAEETAWELFRGRLLDERQTRERRSFVAWSVYERDGDTRAAEPLLSVKFDVRGRTVHVTRGLLCHVWEGHDAGDGVIESRETTRWTRELVGGMAIDQFGEAALRDELMCLLWQGVVGTSRLPLHSLEAPLPAFTLGRLHYVPRPADAGESPLTDWQVALHAGLSSRERVKLLEFTLRSASPDDVPKVALGWASFGFTGRDLLALLRRMFNDVSLSPWTRLVDNALAWLDALVDQQVVTVAEQADFLAHLLCKLGRHLAAYDLVTFHYRGANYPDALLLDAVLRRFLAIGETHPTLFNESSPLPLGGGVAAGMKSQLRRRALRQGCLLRKHYEGHYVPDAPTSPGENARVMPASHPRVPEPQLLQMMRRKKQLFADAPLTSLLSTAARAALAASVADLQRIEERVEMGTALFIDRPLGYGKAAGEPDQTPLLAHEAFSPSLAEKRLSELRELLAACGIEPPSEAIDANFRQRGDVPGVLAAELAASPRPVAALADLRRVADDFVVRLTMPVGLRTLWDALGLPGELPHVLLQRGDPPVLTGYDTEYRVVVELTVDAGAGYTTRAGVEVPRNGVAARWT
jgi:hypothetical protein